MLTIFFVTREHAMPVLRLNERIFRLSLVGPSFYFSEPFNKILIGSLSELLNTRGWEKIAIFAVYVKNGTRWGRDYYV